MIKKIFEIFIMFLFFQSTILSILFIGNILYNIFIGEFQDNYKIFIPTVCFTISSILNYFALQNLQR